MMLMEYQISTGLHLIRNISDMTNQTVCWKRVKIKHVKIYLSKPTTARLLSILKFQDSDSAVGMSLYVVAPIM